MKTLSGIRQAVNVASALGSGRCSRLPKLRPFWRAVRERGWRVTDQNIPFCGTQALFPFDKVSASLSV
jgi:hypothetical protein